MTKKFIFLLIFAVLLISFAFAQEFPSPQDKYVNDFANVLNLTQQEDLKYLFQIVENNTTAEMVFVSLDSINGADMSQYSFDLGNAWGVGKKDKDNGLLILYVKDINKIWVATGYGLEGILPDSKIGRLLDETYVPLRDSGDVANGILAFSYVAANELVINGEEIKSSNGNKELTFWEIILIIVVVLIVFFVIFSIISSFKHSNRKNSWGENSYRTSSSSGGGFSGGGFGGGSFGGGGAGR